MIDADLTDVPRDFVRALHSLRDAKVRPEVHLEEIPGPGRVAPYSVALSAEVFPRRGAEPGSELASGRFVVLHDPAGQEAWHGTFRVVTLVRADVDPEVGFDPLLPDVAWTWLTDALSDAGVGTRELGGTVTRVLSESFGVLQERPHDVEVEIRASWTALDAEVGDHLSAWGTVLCTAAGLPPLPDGVVPLSPRS